MPSSLLRSMRLLLALLLVGGFLSCQQSHGTSPDENGPFVVRQTWPMEAVRMPDSVSWTHEGSSGTFSLHRFADDSFRVTDSFPRSVVSDTLTISLWRLGLRTTTAVTVIQASGGLFVVTGRREFDPLAIGLLAAFDSLRSVDRDSYGS